MINKFNGIGNRNLIIRGQINSPYFNTSFIKNKVGFEDESVKGSSFKDVLGSISNSVNKDLNAPDKLLSEVINGSNDVDVHDVTAAMAKAEMTVTLATNVTSKILTAYEKISQIAV